MSSVHLAIIGLTALGATALGGCGDYDEKVPAHDGDPTKSDTRADVTGADTRDAAGDDAEVAEDAVDADGGDVVAVPTGERAVATVLAVLAAADLPTLGGAGDYTLTAAPARGELLLDGVALAVGGAFSDGDVAGGRLAYRRTAGDVLLDHFTFARDSGEAGAVALSVAPTPLTLAPAADATLFEAADGGLADGAGEHVFLGLTGGGTRRRFLIRFDLATVPAGSLFVGASLALRVNRATGTALPVGLHRITAGWSEGPSATVATGAANEMGGGSGADAQDGDVTWLHRTFPASLWGTPGGDAVATPSASATLVLTQRDAPQTLALPALAADLQAWRDGARDDFGWLVRASDEAGTGVARLVSREGADAPALTVLHLPPGP